MDAGRRYETPGSEKKDFLLKAMAVARVPTFSSTGSLSFNSHKGTRKGTGGT